MAIRSLRRTICICLCGILALLTASSVTNFTRERNPKTVRNQEDDFGIAERNVEKHTVQDEVKPGLLVNMQNTGKFTKPDTNNQSYVVALFLYEQLLASAFTFVQLQCWIKSLGAEFSVRAVELNVLKNRSTLGFSFEDGSLPVISDMFDMASWITQWRNLAAAPLAPIATRNEFLTDIENHPKDVILVQYVYKKKSRVPQCNFTWDTTQLIEHFHESYPLLSMTRKVCLFGSVKITAEEVKEIILGDRSIENTLIIINDWRGIKSGKILMELPICTRGANGYINQAQLKPSVAVLEDAENYANKYLGGFDKYLSISARFELVSEDYWKWSMKQRRAAVSTAIKELMLKVKHLKNHASLQRIFLAYDYGKLGSTSFQKQKFYNSSDLLVKFQEDVYEGKMPYDKYNRSMREFKFRNKAYVAMVQMTIAAKGKCMITLGWGHCIRFVRSLYINYHHLPYDCLKN